jgi:hypothetical protein
MRYLLIFSALLLLGAGCTDVYVQPSVQTCIDKGGIPFTVRVYGGDTQLVRCDFPPKG